MNKFYFTMKGTGFVVFLLGCIVATPIGVVNSYAQVAGFASSRVEGVGTAESGAKRVLNLNPFKRVEHPEHIGTQTPVVQPVATTPSTTVSRSRELAARSETQQQMVKRNTTGSVTKVRTKSNPNVVKKQAKTKKITDVASKLLDELEENFENDSTLAVDSQMNVGREERKSLRDIDSPDTLELLEDESISVEDKDLEVPKIEQNKHKHTISTEGNEKEETSENQNDEELEEDDWEDNRAESFVGSEVSNLDDSVLTIKNSEEQEQHSVSVEALDLQLDSYHAAPTDNPQQGMEVNFENNEQQTSTGRAPIVNIETFGSKKLIVGQESVYKIVVRNQGKEAARHLVITTDLPDSVAIQSVKVQVGVASVVDVDERNISKQCVWKVGTLEPGQAFVLEINLTPTRRVTFELVSNFEFERSSARTGVEVQEPILEALIEGRDSIEWGVEDKFRLRLRNIGNGDAENVELFVSTGDNKATQKIGVLKAGEEKIIETSIKTVANDYFLIDVEATAAYGVKTRATKKIGVLRGKLDVKIDAPELQFVGGDLEAKVRVRNLGDATLQHVDIIAQIPEGVELVFCSNQARENPQKRRVYWSVPFLRPNEETVFSVACRVAEAGVSKFEVVGVDQTGIVAQANSVMNVESIAVLAMRVKSPKEPVPVGKRCTYELIVENNGTRDARDINSGVFLGKGLKPVAIENNCGALFENESKVLFKKIDCLKAGESIVFRVQAEALAPGNQKVQAMLQSASENISLLSEETTYCYSRVKKENKDFRESAFVESPAMTAKKECDYIRK